MAYWETVGAKVGTGVEVSGAETDMQQAADKAGFVDVDRSKWKDATSCLAAGDATLVFADRARRAPPRPFTAALQHDMWQAL